MPGTLLYELYHEYGPRILELNVRSFLQALTSDQWKNRDAWIKQVVLVSNQPIP